MRYFLALLAIVLVAGVSAAAAQTAAAPDSISLKQGDRVRVKAAGVRGDFVLEDVDAVSLWLSDPDGVAQPRVLLDDISSLEIRVPRSLAAGAGRGALIGLGVGFVGGAVYGIANGFDSELVMILGAGYGFFGVILGAIGGLMVPGERWESIPLDARLDAGASPNGTMGVGIAIPIGGS